MNRLDVIGGGEGDNLITSEAFERIKDQIEMYLTIPRLDKYKVTIKNVWNNSNRG